VHLNLAYRWFCRLGLDGQVPDLLDVQQKPPWALPRQRPLTPSVRGDGGALQGFAVDASMIKADANRQRSVPGKDWEPPDDPGHAVREYLAVLDEAAFGGATPVEPKFISTADPASRWTGANGGLAFFAYCTNYLIDLKHAVIMDVEATTAVRQAEVTAQRDMLDRTQERFGLWPERLAADTGYGSAENLAWLVHEKGIEPHIPVFEKSARDDGIFSRSDFSFGHKRDACICPGGKELKRYRRSFATPRDAVGEDGMMRDRATSADCSACALEPRCCPTQPHRRVFRSIHEGARDLARDLSLTDAYPTSRRERKKVEMLFAHLKRTVVGYRSRSRLLFRCISAVHRNCCPSHERGVIRKQPHGCRSYLERLCEAAGWLLGAQVAFKPFLLCHCSRQHRRRRGARHHGVHTDARRRIVERGRLGQADHRMLTCDIFGRTRECSHSCSGRRVDNGPPAGPLHSHGLMLHAVEGARDVDLHRASEVSCR
jgi:Transposase DDE domain